MRGSKKESNTALRQRILDGLFEGDIRPDYDSIMENYGKEVVEELETEGILSPPQENDQNEKDDDVRLQNVVRDRRWDKRVQDIVQIPFVIDSSYTSTQVTTIKNALKDLGDRSKVIRFVPRRNENDYIMVKKTSGCSSEVGKVGGKQEIYMQSYCASSKGIVQHEFIHALGLYHEQSRPDRDEYIKINWENINDNREHNFKKKSSLSTLGNTYDYGSVMHYRDDAFSSNGKDTITPLKPLNGKVLGQRKEADSQDILDIRLLYQCISGPRNLSQYNSNRCTTDCKCWQGESGCKGQSNACQGSLVCKNNQCVADGGGGNPRRTLAPTASRVRPPTNLRPPTTTTGRKWKFIKNNGNCLTVDKRNRYNVAVWKCFQVSANTQKWIYDERSKTIKSMIAGRPCLTWDHDGNGLYKVTVQRCNGLRNQKWYIDETVRGSMLSLRTDIGQCLSKKSNNLDAQLLKCNFTMNQRFQFK